ncbi:hypothetical protein Rhal01_01000 [Rubritalea halochordaticola]|uniref:DEAD/DEAH box helicase n=1 Tax=Rubritalea halochordaticola TaxID=714537 RepID=A0ABP9UWI9_9BACT
MSYCAHVLIFHVRYLNKTSLFTDKNNASFLNGHYKSPVLEIKHITDYLNTSSWTGQFERGVVMAGTKMARGRCVTSVTGEFLPTGDVELVTQIMDKTGHQYESILAFWMENGELQLDASCSCDVRSNCVHCACGLEYLSKGERLSIAFGETPHTENISEGKNLTSIESQKPAPSASDVGPSFLIRIERRPNDKTLNYLPEIYAQPYAVYGKHQVPLEPSGNLRPIVTPEQKIIRKREAEMVALQTLYALDLLPLKKNENFDQLHDDQEETTATHFLKTAKQSTSHIAPPWGVNKKEWPHPDFYWQRFRHEATPALESRGWEVKYSPHVALKPLVFRTDTWKAEMVEEAKGWFHLSAGFEIDGEQFELQPILAALLENNFMEVTEGMPKGQEFMIFLPDGRGLVLPVGRFRHILKTLGEILEFKFTNGPIKMSKLDAALLEADPEIEVEAPDDIEQIAERILSPQKIENIAPPDSLQATLREYQQQGFCWMQFLARSGFCGILADDMGLGKTLQTITHILTEKESGHSKGHPTLVLAPTSVVVNWQREAAKFAPTLSVLILQGSDRHQHFSRINEYDLVLTSYALIHRDLEQHLPIHYHLIALDEAQHIKNAAAQTSQAVRELSSTHRLCLSGTPIENNLGELWSLFAFLMPGLLGTQTQFTETYRSPIEKNHDEEKRNQLNRKVGPLILRRTKHDVAKELPPKTEILHTISLTEEQKDLYETVRSAMDKQVRQAIIARGGQAQIVFLDALLKLRQICCHPSLLKGEDDEAKRYEKLDYHASAKFSYLIELLETLRAEGHRVLIFSQFTSMLSIIEDYLNEESIEYLILTGATKDRQDLVERFQSGEGEVFLISLKAGGTGLTLTGASTVIHYDPWWNPAAENQATDRAYRIGQDKAVFVHKLICQDTVEERIQDMQSKKNTLADNILDGSTQTIDLNEQTMHSLLS